MKVRRVIDGDTFVIENGSKKGERVRLIGIDAPETRRTARKEVGYYGVEAKEYLKALLTGKNVKLVFDVGKKDRSDFVIQYLHFITNSVKKVLGINIRFLFNPRDRK